MLSQIPESLVQLIFRLENLRQANTPSGLAPHKPVLLLTLIAYMEEFGLTENVFPLDDRLLSLFKTHWNLLVKTENVCDITKPLSHLQSDKIWKLSSSSAFQELQNIKSYKRLSLKAPYGFLDQKLFDFLNDSEIREVIRTNLLSRYFPFTEANYYKQFGASVDLAAIDEQILQEPQLEYSKKEVRISVYEGFVRNLRFRQHVLKVYNFTCAMSGYSISGAPIIEACHIAPHSLSGDNRLQNGIALCRNLHTAFDYGLIAVSDDYQILVKDKKYFNESKMNDYSLLALKGKKIHLPENAKHYPSLENLRVHREINNF